MQGGPPAAASGRSMRTHGEACATSSPFLAASHAVLAALSPLCPGTALRLRAVRRAAAGSRLKRICCTACAAVTAPSTRMTRAKMWAPLPCLTGGWRELTAKGKVVACVCCAQAFLRLAERRRMQIRRRLCEHAPLLCLLSVFFALQTQPPTHLQARRPHGSQVCAGPPVQKPVWAPALWQQPGARDGGCIPGERASREVLLIVARLSYVRVLWQGSVM